MVSKRKFYKTTITLEVLTEFDPSYMSIENMVHEMIWGESSGKVLDQTIKIIDGKEAAQRLLVHESDPEFFQLDEDGNDLEQ